MDRSPTPETRTRIIGKRPGRFVVAVMLAVIAIGAISSIPGGTPEARAVGGLLFGSTQDIYFENLAEPTWVTGVEVMVAKGWLNSDAFSLAIHVTSSNGGDKDHGTYGFPLSEGAVLGTEKAQANVKFDWPVDVESSSENIRYSVVVQVLANDQPIGDPIHTTFCYGDCI